MEKVSILMPCYNDGAYLREAFSSIEAQTWKNIEVIVVDDGSDDEMTVQTLHELEAEGRCRLYSQANQGPSAARNRAFSESVGEFILPLDADDCIEPTYIERAIQILRENERIGVCYCRADFIGRETGRWGLPDYSVDQMLIDNVVFVSSVMRRTVFEQAGGYDESMKNGMEDYDFYLSVLENKWEIYQIPEVLFHYRIKHMSRSQKLVLDVKDYHRVYRELFSKHKRLYLCYADSLIPDMREKMLVQRQEIIELKKQIGSMENTLYMRIHRKIRKMFSHHKK